MPKVEVQLHDICLKAGETFNVFLKQKDKDSIRVQLRVKTNGVAEIFADDIEVQPFSEWDYD